MEVSDGLAKGIERAVIAGRLRAAARDYMLKAAALERAAAKYYAGACEALAGMGGDAAGWTTSPSAGERTGRDAGREG
jgi:hypothetical protein